MKPAVLFLMAAAAAAQFVTAPVLIYKVPPHYTVEAQQKKIEGAVVLYAEIGPDGRAHKLRVTRSLGSGLDENAIAAVRQWRFRPGMKDGHPVTTASTIEVNFRLHSPGQEPIDTKGAVRV